jgi:GAF domain-containing protein
MPNLKSSEVQDLIDLLEVARLVVSTLEMDQVLEEILKSAMKLTGTNAGSIALYRKETQELELHAHKGLSQDFIGNTIWRVRQGGLTDRILKSNEPTVINDTTNKKFFTNPLALKEGIKSIVCVPLPSRTISQASSSGRFLPESSRKPVEPALHTLSLRR